MTASDALKAERWVANYDLKSIFSDCELGEDAVIRNFRITAADSKASP